jgi:cytochrome c553
MSNHFAKASGSETEPIGERIVEMPEDVERFVSRDSRAQFVGYVPPGSIDAGRELAATGAGKTQACATCHGPDLKGIGNVPGIAGRFASYVARQLYDFKSGARHGPESVQMKPVVEKLTAEDILALSAYAASLAP